MIKDSPVRHFTRVLHLEDAPDWNDPEVRWGGLQALNISTPLNVPPSIIFWSIEHRLPVYMHPNFVTAFGGGPYAHSYAISENIFSDESARSYRAELGLPPAENLRPLRPSDALRYRVKGQRTIADEQELAEWVAILHGSHASSRTSSLDPTSPEVEVTPPISGSIAHKRPRLSDGDVSSDSLHVLESHAPSPSLPTLVPGHGGSAHYEVILECVYPGNSAPSGPANDPTRSCDPEPTTMPTMVPSTSAEPRPNKRQKTSHSPTPSPTAATEESTSHPGAPEPVLRASPEPSG